MGVRPLYRSRSFRRNEGKTKARGPPGPPVFWIPVGHHHLRRRVQDVVRKSGLNLQVKEKCGITLKAKLCRSALSSFQCKKKNCKLCSMPRNGDVSKIWGPRPRCCDKDLVYAITCNHCNVSYIGETQQTAATRFGQHITSTSKGEDPESAIAQHHREMHGGIDPKFEMSVLGRGDGFVYRKCLEAVCIKYRGDDSLLNRKIEGSGCMDLYF